MFNATIYRSDYTGTTRIAFYQPATDGPGFVYTVYEVEATEEEVERG